ncbi:four helix bundle protein [Candidatus Uhrbacteria bacterium]|nr:four helix bundle protein [Candidatus Uhrbacteria bacterium]
MVWQYSFELSQQIYQLTSQFPKEERFGLVDQMRRAAVSIMSNIAEGSARTKKEWLNFLRVAYGSASELQAQILLSKALSLASAERFLPSEASHGHTLRLLNCAIQKANYK